MKPPERVRSNRIAKMSKVLSRGNLIALIRQYGSPTPLSVAPSLFSTVIDKMRKATWVGALEGDIGTREGQEQRHCSQHELALPRTAEGAGSDPKLRAKPPFEGTAM